MGKQVACSKRGVGTVVYIGLWNLTMEIAFEGLEDTVWYTDGLSKDGGRLKLHRRAI